MTELTEGDYSLYITNQNIYIEYKYYNNILDIDKYSGGITESNIQLSENIKKIKPQKPHAILGIINLEKIEFIIFVKSAYVIGKIEEAEVFRVKEVELIPIVPDKELDYLGSEVRNLVEGIKNLYTLGFFYSFNYDLTNSLQNQSKLKELDILTSANKKFFWNFCLYKNFYLTNNLNEKEKENANEKYNENRNGYDEGNLSFISTLKVNKIWMVVCIYGYVGIVNLKIDYNLTSEKTAVYLISRRSIFHSGTRYLSRGVDDNGHVANHVETEQILKIKDNLFSFMQLRGSVPIFFEQPGIQANTNIIRNATMTAPAFKKHIQEIRDDFGYIYLINLMNMKKPNEHIITENYELQIKNNELKNLKYLFWDFQNKCKFDNYEPLDDFAKDLEGVFKIFKYHHEKDQGKIIKKQGGIIRTNCLDCLDRTNVVQARIGWKVLELLVKKIKKLNNK
jgi:hypothetical protein